MKTNRIFKFAIATALSACCVAGIVGCTTDEEAIPDELTSDTGLTGGVAATVNGVEIEEDKVTRAINNFRLNNSYTEEDKWKEYLENRKYTVESMRYEIIGSLVDQELVKQCAEQLGVSTNDEEIQSYVDKMVEQYSSEEAWLNAVEEAGWEDGVEGYKKALNFSILEKKLQDQFDAEVEASFEDEDTLLAKLQDSSTTYTGAKRTSHILFGEGDQELANEVREKLANGEMTFEEAVAEYSTDDTTKENGGDVGWDKTNSFVTEYTDAVANLENVGDISDVTESKYGYQNIVLTDVWTAPDTWGSVDDMPEEFVTEIKTNAIETDGETKYTDWLDSMRPANDVVVNPMPDNVPYKVDMSGVYSDEEAAEITQKALDELVKGVAATEEAAEAAEAAGDDADAAAADGDADAAAADADAAAGAADAAVNDEAAADEQNPTENSQ